MIDELVNWAKGEIERIEAEYAQGMRERQAKRKAKAAPPRRKKRTYVEYEPSESCTCHLGNPPCHRCESATTT